MNINSLSSHATLTSHTTTVQNHQSEIDQPDSETITHENITKKIPLSDGANTKDITARQITPCEQKDRHSPIPQEAPLTLLTGTTCEDSSTKVKVLLEKADEYLDDVPNSWSNASFKNIKFIKENFGNTLDKDTPEHDSFYKEMVGRLILKAMTYAKERPKIIFDLKPLLDDQNLQKFITPETIWPALQLINEKIEADKKESNIGFEIRPRSWDEHASNTNMENMLTILSLALKTQETRSHAIESIKSIVSTTMTENKISNKLLQMFKTDYKNQYASSEIKSSLYGLAIGAIIETITPNDGKTKICPYRLGRIADQLCYLLSALDPKYLTKEQSTALFSSLIKFFINFAYGKTTIETKTLDKEDIDKCLHKMLSFTVRNMSEVDLDPVLLFPFFLLGWKANYNIEDTQFVEAQIFYDFSWHIAIHTARRPMLDSIADDEYDNFISSIEKAWNNLCKTPCRNPNIHRLIEETIKLTTNTNRKKQLQDWINTHDRRYPDINFPQFTWHNPKRKRVSEKKDTDCLKVQWEELAKKLGYELTGDFNKDYREMSRIVHPDKCKISNPAVAHEMMTKLNELRNKYTQQ